MKIKDVILKIAQEQRTFTANDVIQSLNNKYSRAYILRFIKKLIQEKKLAKSGSTRNARYASIEHIGELETFFKKRYRNVNLKEHEILEDFFMKSPVLNGIQEDAKSIFEYAFTEMVNNAIEHSESKYIEVSVEKKEKSLTLIVEDFGIGVYRNIMRKMNLSSPLEALQDLLKGKITTQPHAHSGEGIFFTSKASDTFTLESYGYELRVDNNLPDVFVREIENSKRGTTVTFTIALATRRHLNEVFEKYYSDPEELSFDKTEVRIKLYTLESIYVSRSQARRVLSGLEKFRSVILDFDKVPGIGQAFADEIFRVFALRHPEITITPMNMNETVRFMVGRVDTPPSKN